MVLQLRQSPQHARVMRPPGVGGPYGPAADACVPEHRLAWFTAACGTAVVTGVLFRFVDPDAPPA